VRARQGAPDIPRDYDLGTCLHDDLFTMLCEAEADKKIPSKAATKTNSDETEEAWKQALGCMDRGRVVSSARGGPAAACRAPSRGTCRYIGRMV
jgi:hypothetical protein